jgi:hypothetical protein
MGWGKTYIMRGVGDAEGFWCGRGCWDALEDDWDAWEFGLGLNFDALELRDARNGVMLNLQWEREDRDRALRRECRRGTLGRKVTRLA